MEIWTALIIGFAGSLHCIGMCGPIVLALPTKIYSKNLAFILKRFLYNIGRVTTYALIGIVVGYLGQSLKIWGYQQTLSILIGVIILLWVIVPKKHHKIITDKSLIKKGFNFLQRHIGKLFIKQDYLSFYVIGILNGFLPCGFVYMGAAGAASTGNYFSGGLYMALFGMGTVPAMFILSIFGKYFNQSLRNNYNKVVPYFAVILALLFILRGMNLGIPIISPHMMH